MNEDFNFAELCRLCSLKSNHQLQIFDKEGEQRQLLFKIRSCIPAVVSHLSRYIWRILRYLQSFVIKFIISRFYKFISFFKNVHEKNIKNKLLKVIWKKLVRHVLIVKVSSESLYCIQKLEYKIKIV